MVKEKGWLVVITAILAISGLIAYVLSQNQDGALLSVGIAFIAGLAGYSMPARFK